jgi:hypothetical protein
VAGVGSRPAHRGIDRQNASASERFCDRVAAWLTGLGGRAPDAAPRGSARNASRS